MERMQSNGLKVPFGAKANMLFAPVDIAESGLACGCTCPGCGAQLVIRQGTKRRHFAHFRCLGTKHCVESAIHKAAIQVLLEAKHFRVPEKKIVESITTKAGLSHKGEQVQAKERSIRFDNAACEVHMAVSDSEAVRPDVVGYRNGRQILVEMCFKHAVDDEKRKKLRHLGFPVIEISLSDLDAEEGFDAIRTRVIDEVADKKWLVYPGEEAARHALREQLRQEGDVIDERHRKERAAVEQQAREAQQKQLEKEQRIKAAHDTFKNLPGAQKEQILRKKLGISAAWPRYLRLRNDENLAINALPHLWQSSVFLRFVYKRPRYEYIFETTDVITWVKYRFGLKEQSEATAREAIRKFLAYLGGCGFIEWKYDPYGPGFYKVLHNRLEPPERQNAKKVLITKAIAIPPFRPAAPGQVVGRDWQWIDEWPSHEEAMKTATKWICRSRDHYIDIVNRLYASQVRPSDPRNFAEMMVSSGISARDTLSFLAEAKLAR